jgi:AcrR family transcriptional regulator
MKKADESPHPGTTSDLERRRRILQEARRRLEHYGFEKTTMAEIAADAGIAVGTLYLYFRNKEDLLFAFGKECQDRYVDAQQQLARSRIPPAERLRQLTHLRVLGLKEQMEATPHGGEILMGMMQTGHTCCQARERLEVEMIEQILREGIASGEFSVEDPARAARAFRCAFSGLLPPASLGRPAEGVRREVDAVYELVLRGLKASAATADLKREPAQLEPAVGAGPEE